MVHPDALELVRHALGLAEAVRPGETPGEAEQRGGERGGEQTRPPCVQAKPRQEKQRAREALQTALGIDGRRAGRDEA